MWWVSDAVLFDTARDTAALTISDLLTSPAGLGAAADLVDGFDRAALEGLFAGESHAIIRDARS